MSNRFRILPLGLIAIAAFYLLLAGAFSQIMHFSRALDEGYHLEYISFIKQKGRLPITYEERSQITRADFPPLYHLLVSALSANVSTQGPPQFKFFWDSFRYRAMDHQADQVWTIYTEDYQPPYLGQFLVWQIGRWVSIALSLATVVVVFFTLRETPLRQIPLAPLAGAALLSFIPRYIILGSALNDDNLLGLLAALYFWLLLKAIKEPARRWPFIGLGILLGLSLTVKYTLIVAPLELIVVCIVIARNNRLGWRWAATRLGLVGGIALLCSSWWFGWNIWFLNTVAQDGWPAGLLKPLLTGGKDTTMNRLGGLFSGGQVGLTELPEDTIVGAWPGWLKTIFISFWGVNIQDAFPPFYPYIYLVIGLALATAVFGLERLWRTDPTARKWLTLLFFHTGLFFILPVIRFGLTRRLSVAAQGRHILIPAAAAIVTLLIWGLLTAIPRRWQRPTLALIVVGLIGWSGVHLYRFEASATPPLPLRALPQAAEWLPSRLQANTRFGDNVELVSYHLDPQPDRGRLRIELAWRCLAYINENYLLEVTLVNSQGEKVSHWLGYTGQGRLPTLAWDPGDSIFDRLALPLPNLPAGDYTPQIQLISRTGPLSIQSGEKTETHNEESEAKEGETTTILALESVSLPQTSRFSYQKIANSVGFVLWQSDLSTFRYPATITILTDGPGDLQLLDPSGQGWSPTRSEANIHQFIIGPRWLSGEYRLQATPPGGNPAVTQPILTVENWQPRQFQVPAGIEVPAQANFANQLNYLGYSLPQKQVKAGESFPLTLYWQALPNMSPQADFIQFNHLLDSAGRLRGGYDRHPLEYYSTLLWAPGEVVVDGYTVPVDAGAPPGQYYLNVGYYLIVGEAAVNLPLVENEQMSNVTSVTVGPVEVIAP